MKTFECVRIRFSPEKGTPQFLKSAQFWIITIICNTEILILNMYVFKQISIYFSLYPTVHVKMFDASA